MSHFRQPGDKELSKQDYKRINKKLAPFYDHIKQLTKVQDQFIQNPLAAIKSDAEDLFLPKPQQPNKYEIAEEVVYMLKKRSKKIKKKTELILSSNGELHKKQQSNVKTFLKSKNWIELLRVLTTDPIPTPALTHITSTKNEGAFRKMVGKINKKLKRALRIKSKLIIGHKNLGYTLNPGYKITYTSHRVDKSKLK